MASQAAALVTWSMSVENVATSSAEYVVVRLRLRAEGLEACCPSNEC